MIILEKLPTISIVVPNYNGGKTIAKTLQSLVDQDYPKLEIIVVDGGSTDNSVEVIQQFESHITWWVSEKDRGQSNAINKGFAQCTGEIINWLCSDDILKLGTLYTVGKFFANSPQVDVLVGCSQVIFTNDNYAQSNEDIHFWLTLLTQMMGLGKRVISIDKQIKNSYTKTPSIDDLSLLPIHNSIAQPSCFYRRKLLNRNPPINESYNYAMDTELWNYFQSQGVRWKCIDEVLSICIQDGQNKSSTGGYKVTLELESIYNTYVQEWIPLTFWHRRLRYPLERFLASNPAKFWLYLVAPLWIIFTLILSPFYGFERVWNMRWKRWA